MHTYKHMFAVPTHGDEISVHVEERLCGPDLTDAFVVRVHGVKEHPISVFEIGVGEHHAAAKAMTVAHQVDDMIWALVDKLEGEAS